MKMMEAWHGGIGKRKVAWRRQNRKNAESVGQQLAGGDSSNGCVMENGGQPMSGKAWA
jgi:hypothetical protein